MSGKTTRHPHLSVISGLHYAKLVFRSVLLLAATVIYIAGRLRHATQPFAGVESRPFILLFIWLVFVAEMIQRFFPSPLESMGCQKQFARNYQGSELPPEAARIIRAETNRPTLAVAASWLALNGVLGALYFTGIFDEGIMLLISLVFSVCDMICILFFCPFQTWFMKNKCCGSCRIYNWDYAMMFTPLIFVKSVYTWSILVFAIALLLRWEIAYCAHPERFFEATNRSLACANCPEKLCHHKKQLRDFLQKNRHLLRLSELDLEKYRELLRKRLGKHK